MSKDKEKIIEEEIKSRERERDFKFDENLFLDSERKELDASDRNQGYWQIKDLNEFNSQTIELVLARQKEEFERVVEGKKFDPFFGEGEKSRDYGNGYNQALTDILKDLEDLWKNYTKND